jgi:small subunit ribosomal protein S2
MVSARIMLEAGVHFGHRTHLRHPKMSPFIHTTDSDQKMDIIDLQQTYQYLGKICRFLRVTVTKETKILFVGKKAPSTIRSIAESCDSFHVTQRWLGGLLTNWRTMRRSIRTLRRLDYEFRSGQIGVLPKKEQARLKKKREKAEKFFGGIKKMTTLPDYVILASQRREFHAVRECLKLRIKTISILDTDSDLKFAHFFVPGNDDSTKSLELLLGEFSKAINEGRRKDAASAETNL